MKLLAEPRTRERWTKGEGGILSIEERKSNQNDPKEEKGANRRKGILIGAKKQEKKCEDEARHLEDLGRSSQEGVYKKKKKASPGTSLVVPWLRLPAPKAGGLGSIPGRGTMIPHATAKTPHSQINKNEY